MKADETGQSVDPFSFFPGIVSRIAGLGGETAGHDPTYVFHTPYVAAARGAAEFTLAFHGLRASRGTLSVRIHMLPTDRSAHARLVNSERISLPRLIRQDGSMTMGFESYRGMSYAVYGSIGDDTDAVADGLTIMLDRPYDPATDVDAAPAERTSFGNEALTASAQMVSATPPSLVAPVSQIYTRAQADEASFAAWRTRLRAGDATDRDLWEHVYVLQILSCYGLLQPGARGLGLDVNNGPVPAMLAALGLGVVVTGRDPDAADVVLDRLRRPDLCDDAKFDAGVSFSEADPAAIPTGLTNFDFAWSRAASRLTSPAATIGFVESSMGCVAAGGLVIQLFDFLGGTELPPDAADRTFVRKEVAERLALQLISRGHEVAQIRTEPGDGARRGRIQGARATGLVSSFGLVARRAPMAR